MTLSADILALSPLAYWKLDESSGNFADSSGNAVTLTANGTPVYAQSSLLKDVSGTSIAFDGSTDYGVSANNSDVIKATLNVFSTTETAANAAFFSRFSSSGDRVRFFRWTVNSDKLTFAHDATTHVFTHAKTADSYLADGNPHIIITTWDGVDLFCYVDGVEVGRSTQVTNPYTGVGGLFYFGVINNTTNSFYFQGNMDDAAVFGSHLTFDDVLTLSIGVLIGIPVTISETSGIVDWRATAIGSVNGTKYGSQDTSGIIANMFISIIQPMNVTVSPKINGRWVANTAIPLDYLVIATDPSATPHLWKCTAAGTTHATTEPTWNLSGTTTDGTVTWTYVDELVQPVTHGPLIPS